MSAPYKSQGFNAAHIQNLIDSEVAESLTLEYKQKLPSDQSEEKREFLYDVAAMSNAAGGDIVYGIVDRRGQDNQSTGIADSFAVMKLSNPQTDIDRLSNLIKDGIAPRLSGIIMQTVNCPDGDVLVIRVPRSWSKPHMVTIGAVNKFFGE
ncbi:MAG: AlbA family DNA-binding domain-containing protein [Acidobacteriaceae bacterium]